MTTRQLQELLKIDRVTIYRMLEDGRLRGFKVGGQWRFPRRDVDRWLAQQQPSHQAPAAEPMEADRVPAMAAVLPLSCVQGVQNILAEAAGACAVTLSPDGQMLTQMSGCSSMCRRILDSPEAARRCHAGWDAAIQHAGSPSPTTCHAGLNYVSDRVIVDDTPVAFILVGQLVPPTIHRLDLAKGLADLSRTCDIDGRELQRAREELSVPSSKEAFGRISRLLRITAQTLSEMGQERAHILGRLQRIADLTVID